MKLIYTLFAVAILLTGNSKQSFAQTSNTKPIKSQRKYIPTKQIRSAAKTKTPIAVSKKKKTKAAPKQDFIKTFIDKLENNPKYVMIESSFSSDGLEWGKYFKDYSLAVGIRLRNYTIGGVFALSNVYRKYFFDSLNISFGLSLGNKKFRKVQENFFEAEVDRSKIYEKYNVFDVEKEFLELAAETGIGFHYFINKKFFFGIELASIYFPIATIIEPEPVFYEEASESDLNMMDHQINSYAQQPGFSALSLQISLFL
ncbi:MAG: hypothetical protein AB8G05_25010 [Oligoflexales bacterium]